MKEASGLLDEPAAERLQRACRTTVGDSLRSITYFTEGEFEQTYLRSDLEADADLAGFVESESEGFRARTDYRGSELGDYRYTIRVFDGGFLVTVVSGGRGAFITTDGLTVQRSREAASAVSEVLDELDDLGGN